MADWFKIYENDIDEMRLQWAINEASEVLPVWIVLMSEACRHKNATLSGYCQDYELFALAKKINVSPSKVNQAIELLVKINYLTRMPEKTLFIRKWDEKQSEYCQRKTRLQNQTGHKHHTNRTKNKDIVPTLSEQCPDSVRQEERRGEDIQKKAPCSQIEAEKALNGYKKSHKSVSPNAWKFIELWRAKHLEHFGVPYKNDGASDEIASEPLASLTGYTPESLMDIAEKAWKNPEGFWSKFATSISGFSKKFNEIRKEVGALKGKPENRERFI